MLRRNVLGPLSRPLQVTILALALIVLLGGCFPPSTALPPATETAIAANATAPTFTPAPASPAPIQTPAPTVAETAIPSPTPAITVTVMPADLAVGIVVQQADWSIQVVDAHGSAMPLYQAAGPVDMISIFPPGNVVSDTMYLPFTGKPASIVRLDARGGQPVADITGQVYGLAASPDRLAFGVADIAAGSPTAEIRVSRLDGTQATTVYSQTMPAAPQVLRVFRWSPDGKTLYFGKEPVGLGGYILFGGLSNLWTYDSASGQTAELVHQPAPNAVICIDDLSPDASTAADHCNPKRDGTDRCGHPGNANRAPAGRDPGIRGDRQCTLQPGR